MRKITLFFGSCLLLMVVSCRVQQNPVQTSSVAGVSGQASLKVPYIVAESVAAHVSFLASDSLLGRDTGSEGLAKAATYIEEEFKENGIAPYFDTYRDHFDALGVPTYNVVGFLKGTDPVLSNEVVIIGAHYDHIGTAVAVGDDVIANGANDNAAGTAAVLALSSHFGKAKTNKRSVLFVLFAAEEKGLLGSQHLSSDLKSKGIDLYTMINFEMIGVPLNGTSYQAYLTGYHTSNMADQLNAYSGKELLGYLPKAQEFNLFQRSDNYPFYTTFEVPCQTISSFDFTNYDFYHHVDDEASQLDFEHMADFVSDCIPALEGVFNSASKEIKTREQQQEQLSDENK